MFSIIALTSSAANSSWLGSVARRKRFQKTGSTTEFPFFVGSF